MNYVSWGIPKLWLVLSGKTIMIHHYFTKRPCINFHYSLQCLGRTKYVSFKSSFTLRSLLPEVPQPSCTSTISVLATVARWKKNRGDLVDSVHRDEIHGERGPFTQNHRKSSQILVYSENPFFLCLLFVEGRWNIPFNRNTATRSFFFPDPTVFPSSEKNVELNQKDCGRM